MDEVQKSNNSKCHSHSSLHDEKHYYTLASQQHSLSCMCLLGGATWVIIQAILVSPEWKQERWERTPWNPTGMPEWWWWDNVSTISAIGGGWRRRRRGGGGGGGRRGRRGGRRRTRRRGGRRSRGRRRTTTTTMAATTTTTTTLAPHYCAIAGKVTPTHQTSSWMGMWHALGIVLGHYVEMSNVESKRHEHRVPSE